MLVAKGVTQPDGSYIWTCNQCDGTGVFALYACDWCYGLDIHLIVEALKEGARGQRYYALLKAFLSVKGKEMVDFAQTLRSETGGFSPAAVGWVSLSFGLNFKATAEWLEETHVLRAGWYDRVMNGRVLGENGKRRPVRVGDIYEAARERYS